MSAIDARRGDRERMVGRLEIRDPRVVAAMRSVPRHEFVPEEYSAIAYADEPVPLGFGDATASAPHMVAEMLDEAEVREGNRVLDIGGGMGYLAALLAELVGAYGHVYSVEIEPALADEARRRLRENGFAQRTTVVTADGWSGDPEHALFDAILVSCATRELPAAWPAQLVDGGRLVAPIGDRLEQELVTYTRSGPGGTLNSGPRVRFVALKRAPTSHI